MTVTQYINRPAPLALPPAIDLLGNEPAGTGVHFAADRHYIRDPGTPANNRLATTADLITAGTMTFTRASSAWGVGRLGYLQEFAAGVPRLVYDPLSRLTSASNMQLRIGVKAITVSAGYAYAAGDFVALTDAGNTARWMRGRVISRVGTLLVVDVYWVVFGVSGSAASWVICKSLGYLAEPQASNLTTYGNDFANAAWSKENTSITAGAGMAPDGSMTASLVTTTAASGFRSLRKINQAGLSAASIPSIFVKHQTGSGIVGITVQNISGNSYAARFDLIAGTIYQSGTNGSTALIAPGPLGYWLIALAVPSADDDSTNIIKFIDFDSSQGLGASVLAWGAQHELGAYPTSYIPTTTAAVTRSFDWLRIDVAKFPFNTAAGTVIATARPSPDRASFNHYLWQLMNVSTDRIFVRNYSAGTAGLETYVVANAVSKSVAKVGVATARFKHATAWATGRLQTVANGVAAGDRSDVILPEGITRLDVASQGSVNQYGSPIEALAYIPRDLSEPEMIARTTL